MITKNIEIVPYDSNWPSVFEHESHSIKQALGDNCVEIHHIDNPENQKTHPTYISVGKK